jgi:hypothetical protein
LSIGTEIETRLRVTRTPPWLERVEEYYCAQSFGRKIVCYKWDILEHERDIIPATK